MRNLNLIVLSAFVAGACTSAVEPCQITTDDAGLSIFTCPGADPIPLDGLAHNGAQGPDGRDGVFASGRLEGNLLITDDGDIARYQGVTEVTGDVLVTSLSGSYGPTAIVLPNLKTVGGNLRIALLQGATHIVLDALEYVGGEVNISNIEGLTQLGSFGKLSEVGLGVDIEDIVGDLLSINAFHAIKHFTQDDTLESYAVLGYIEGAPEIDVFHALERVGYLDLTALTDTMSIKGFDALQDVTGATHIGHSPALSTLPSFSAMTHSNEMTIHYLDSIEQISGFDALETIGYLEISNNPALTTMPDFDALTAASGGIFVNDNESLTSTGAFSSLTNIAGSLLVARNDALTHISAFPQLQSADIYLEHNASITSIGGFPNLTELDELVLSYNGELTELGGFDSLMTAHSFIEIWGNPKLCATKAQAFFDAITTRGGTIGSQDAGDNKSGC